MTRRSATSLLLFALGMLLPASLAAPAAAQDQDVMVVPDVVYSTSYGRPLTLDVYVPPGDATRAAVLLIPGGGWNPSERQEGDLPLVIARAGFVVFSAQYTPAPEASFPVQVQELQEAVRWVREHASEYRVDPSRLAAMGSSAGGHLAGLLATVGEGALNEGSRVMAGVSWSGPMELALMVRSGGRLETFERFLGCSGQEACLPTAEAASPVNHVDATDAPMFLANSTEERIPLEQAVVMADALEASGVPYELVEVPGAHHGKSLEAVPEVVQDTFRFLRRWLGVDADGQLGALPHRSAVGTVQPGERLTVSPGPATARPDERGGGRRGFLVVVWVGLAILVVGLIVAEIVRRYRRPDRRAL
jgi:acetyl esterase/lipase